MAKILVADDQQVFLKVIDTILSNEGYEVSTATSGKEAREKLAEEPFDLLVTDIQMEPVSGMDLLKEINESQQELCVIMLTSCEQVDVAIRAMKLGAFDYLTKPIQMADLIEAVQRALEYIQSKSSRLDTAKLEYQDTQQKLNGVVAKSHHMIRVCEMIARVAPTQANVLICSEPGCGAELAATNLHRYSLRKDMPFVKIDCATIPPDKMEATLFGENGKKNDGLYHAALGGTMFIREIDKLSLPMQEQLIRTLEESDLLKKETACDMDIRMIADSYADMEEQVKSGQFRNDLYSYIRTFFINIPPLRERQEDIIPLLAQQIEQHINDALEMPFINHEAENLLKHYRWPGNINELIDVARHAFEHLENNTITTASLPPELVEEASITCEVLNGLKPIESLKGKSLQAFLHNEERSPLKQALANNSDTADKPSAPPHNPARYNNDAAAHDDASPRWI